MSNNQHFYDLLGVPKNASEAQIKKAYRNSALKNHPDKGGDTEKFKEISMAYETLSDPQKKQLYDQFGEEGLKKGAQGSQNYHDPFNLFRHMFGGGFSFQSGNNRHHQQQKCLDIHKTFTLTLEEIFRGITANIECQIQQNCPKCLGKGVKEGIPSGKCYTCNGQGSRFITRMIGPGIIQQMLCSCDQCHGTGRCVKKGDECQVCNGIQTIKISKTMNLKLPAGISCNDNILIQGVGNQHPDKISGDIKVQIK